MEIRRIFVIGAGTMGSGIAQMAATSGYKVIMMDVVPEQLERARAVIAKSTERLLSKGSITEEQREAALNIPTTSGLKGISEADMVIEAASENYELKFNIFRD